MQSVYKREVLDCLRAQITASLEVMDRAATTTREAATHEESIAEDKYDTRGLEASYLAHGQAKRAAELLDQLKILETLNLRNFKPTEQIAVTALVKLSIEFANRKIESEILLIPLRAGAQLQVKGAVVQVISVDTPLGKELLGKQVGDEFTLQIAGQEKNYSVLEIA